LRRLSSHFLVSATLCAVMCAAALPAQALAQGDPVVFLKKQDKQVRSILERAADAKRADKLSKALNRMLDFEVLSKHALDAHWDGLTPAQRTEFVDLLRQLVERSYQKNMKSTANYQVRYGDAREATTGTVVQTTARSRKNRRAPEVSIDYTMTVRDGQWKVYDVVTDGVSLVDNYRSQFNRIIRKKGFDALVEKMRTRLAKQGVM